MYVTILDCETTGLNPQYGDKIIEIALILYAFEDGKLVEQKRFETFINPEMEIDEKISLITGIRNEDVKNAPKIEAVKNDILPFLDNTFSPIIVGHNIFFDITFLKESGFDIKNDFIDTLDLALLFEENSTSLSLESLSLRHSIAHTSHRAMGDVLANKEIFDLYLQEMRKIPAHLHEIIGYIMSKSNWAGKILFPFKNEKEIEQSYENFISFLAEKNKTITSPISQQQVETDQQLEDIILKNLQENKKTIATLPCETEKVYTSLFTAMQYAKEKTENEKILYLYPFLNDEIQKAYSTLKEKEERKDICLYYDKHSLISLNQFFDFFHNKTTLDRHETVFALKIFSWLMETNTGYVRELFLPYNFRIYVPSITGKSRNNVVPDIFIQQYEKEYNEAKVVLMRYNDFFSLSPENILFDTYPHLIFENGSMLEDQLLFSLTTILSIHRLTAFCQSLHMTGKEKENVQLLQEKIPFFFSYTGMYVQKKLENETGELLLEGKDVNNLSFKQVKKITEECLELLAALQNILENSEQKKEHAVIINMLQCLLHPSPATILYAEIKPDGEVILKETKLEVEQFFHSLMQNKQSILILSSPLIDLEKQLDLQEYETVHSESCHSYPIDSYLVKDMDVKATNSYIQQLKNTIYDISCNKQKNVVFLISSQKLIEQIIVSLAPLLRSNKIPFIAQRFSGGEKKILEKYEKDNFSSLLFCTPELFHKLPHEKMEANLFVLQKLPFAYTNGLIDSYRKQKYTNEFMDYALPKSLLRFENIMRSIIHVKAEHKKIVILDNKIVTTQYSQYFQKLLPHQEKIVTITAKNILSSLAEKQTKQTLF